MSDEQNIFEEETNTSGQPQSGGAMNADQSAAAGQNADAGQSADTERNAGTAQNAAGEGQSADGSWQQNAGGDQSGNWYQQQGASYSGQYQSQNQQYSTPSIHCSLDFRCPLDSYGSITTQFGGSDPWGRGHNGTDFSAPGGTPIYAVADGVVSVATSHYSYGNYVQISHGTADDGKTYATLYAHMSSYVVSVGQSVSKGQVIGYVGNTGEVYGKYGGYHLHLELRVNNVRVNPLSYIPH